MSCIWLKLVVLLCLDLINITICIPIVNTTDLLDQINNETTELNTTHLFNKKENENFTTESKIHVSNESRQIIETEKIDREETEVEDFTDAPDEMKLSDSFLDHSFDSFFSDDIFNIPSTDENNIATEWYKDPNLDNNNNNFETETKDSDIIDDLQSFMAGNQNVFKDYAPLNVTRNIFKFDYNNNEKAENINSKIDGNSFIEPTQLELEPYKFRMIWFNGFLSFEIISEKMNFSIPEKNNPVSVYANDYVFNVTWKSGYNNLNNSLCFIKEMSQLELKAVLNLVNDGVMEIFKSIHDMNSLLTIEDEYVWSDIIKTEPLIQLEDEIFCKVYFIQDINRKIVHDSYIARYWTFGVLSAVCLIVLPISIIKFSSIIKNFRAISE